MPAPAEGRRPRSRRLLSQEEILDAALDLLDEGGPHAASVRGIATRVGWPGTRCTPTSRTRRR